VAELADYESRKIKTHIVVTRSLLHLISIPVIGPVIRKKLQEKIHAFHLEVGTYETAVLLIRNANRCAVGERVCASCSRSAPVTESVFLDELADVMVRSRQARFVPAGDAVACLEKYPKNPIIVARIAGRRQEICRSYPEDCIYWNMKKRDFLF